MAKRSTHTTGCDCAICSGRLDHDSFYEKIAHDIAVDGQSLVGVGAGPDTPPFIYTVGNHEEGLPELLLIGMASASIGAVMNILGRRLRYMGHPFDDGGLVDIGGKVPLKIIDVRDPRGLADYAIQAEHYWKLAGSADPVRLQQVLVPDPAGRYPGDPECSAPYRGVPVLRGN